VEVAKLKAIAAKNVRSSIGKVDIKKSAKNISTTLPTPFPPSLRISLPKSLKPYSCV